MSALDLSPNRSRPSSVPRDATRRPILLLHTFDDALAHVAVNEHRDEVVNARAGEEVAQPLGPLSLWHQAPLLTRTRRSAI
jgi:hypothetical protein